jgi:hypothetical protein
MATAFNIDPRMVGARRTFIPTDYSPTAQLGTAALADSDVLAQLIAGLQSFYNPSSAGGGQGEPSIMDVLNQSQAQGQAGVGDGVQDNPGGMTVAPGTATVDPGLVSTLGNIMSAAGTLSNSPTTASAGSLLGLAGPLSQQGPADAVQTFGTIGAGIAGANPIAVGGINALIDMMQDPVPATPADIAGKLTNIALSATPLGIVNSIAGMLFGKNAGNVVKGALTPVSDISISDALAKQANQEAEAKNIDPLEALLSLNQAFGTAPAGVSGRTAEADVSTIGMDMFGPNLSMGPSPNEASIASGSSPSLDVSGGSADLMGAAADAIAGALMDAMSAAGGSGDLNTGDSGGSDGGTWGGDGGDGLL